MNPPPRLDPEQVKKAALFSFMASAPVLVGTTILMNGDADYWAKVKESATTAGKSLSLVDEAHAQQGSITHHGTGVWWAYGASGSYTVVAPPPPPPPPPPQSLATLGGDGDGDSDCDAGSGDDAI